MRPCLRWLVWLFPMLVQGGCGPEEQGPDAVVLGAQIWWGDQEHEDVRDYLRACADFLGRHDFDGLDIVFDGRLSSVADSCGRAVAGCTLRERMAAIIYDQPSIWNTALCHEAVHVFVAPNDLEHEAPVWRELGDAGLNGGDRREAP